jgi:phosphoenolpyruvate carboxylase
MVVSRRAFSWRGYRRGESDLHFRHTFDDCFQALLATGFDAQTIRKTLISQNSELVLTAHPTQATRRTLLNKYSKIAELLEQRDRTALTPSELARLHSGIKREIVSIWRTNTVRG